MTYINIPLETQILSQVMASSGKTLKRACEVIIRKPLEFKSEFPLDLEENILDVQKFQIESQEFIGALATKALFISSIKNDVVQTEKLSLPKFLNNSVTNFQVLENQIILYNKNEIFYGEIQLNDQIELNFSSLVSIKLPSEIIFATIVGMELLVFDKNLLANVFKFNEGLYETEPSVKIDLQKKISNYFDLNLTNLKLVHNQFNNDLLILNPQYGIIIFPLKIFLNSALDQQNILFIQIQNISHFTSQNEQLFLITEDSELIEINYHSTEVYSFINRKIAMDKTFHCIAMKANQRFLYVFYENYFIQLEHSIPKQYLSDEKAIVKFENYTLNAKDKIVISTLESNIFVYNNNTIQQFKLKQQVDLSCSLKKLRKQKIHKIQIKTYNKNCSDGNFYLPFNSFCLQNLKIKFVKAIKNETNITAEGNKEVTSKLEELQLMLENKFNQEKIQLMEQIKKEMIDKFNKELQLKLQQQEEQLKANQTQEQQLNESDYNQEQLKKIIEEKQKQYQEQLEEQSRQIKSQYEQLLNEKIQELQKQYVDNIDFSKLPKIEFNQTQIIEDTPSENPTTIDTKFLLFFIVLVIILIITTFYYKACKQQMIKFAQTILGVEMVQKVEETFNLKDELQNQGIQLFSEEKKGDYQQGEEIFDTNFDEI